MTVPEGTFRLYPRITPPLTAGDYRLTSTQELSASRPGQNLGPDDLDVDPLTTHVRVRAPQYQLPPDQVLSTFPPAGSEGAYGSRLPQVVIRRRTLPWERSVGPGHEDEPVARAGAHRRGRGRDAAEPAGGRLRDTRRRARPTRGRRARATASRYASPWSTVSSRPRRRCALLAHAREVDIHDTELMMGDDDGYLAVVISNRLPLPGRDAAGSEMPVKYLACLVNLSEQFDQLLEEAPAPSVFTLPPRAIALATEVTLADVDHATMGSRDYTGGPAGGLAGAGAVPHAAGPTPATHTTRAALDDGLATPYETAPGWTQQVASAGVTEVYTAMADPFRNAVVSGYLGGDLPTWTRPWCSRCCCTGGSQHRQT